VLTNLIGFWKSFVCGRNTCGAGVVFSRVLRLFGLGWKAFLWWVFGGSGEAAQPAQVPGRLPIPVMTTFIFTATRARGGVRGTGVDVAHSNNRSGLASALLLPRSSLILVLALVLALVVAPRPVLSIHV
jgi:hypothetical protein